MELRQYEAVLAKQVAEERAQQRREAIHRFHDATFKAACLGISMGELMDLASRLYVEAEVSF